MPWTACQKIADLSSIIQLLTAFSSPLVACLASALLNCSAPQIERRLIPSGKVDSGKKVTCCGFSRFSISLDSNLEH
ncbi:hypothetical protein GN956_G12395 [Arapaima gigas]